jgi:hypothetical protein
MNRELLYSDKLSNIAQSQRDAFLNKVSDVSKNLGINPDWLMLVMYKESGINPKAINPSAGATGLIQFMPSTAKSLGTTTTALRTMSAVNQLDYVQKYFENIKKWFKDTEYNSFYDLYLATFYPASVGKDNSFVFGSEKKGTESQIKSYQKKIFDQNPAISKFSKLNGRTDSISIKDFKDYTQDALDKSGVNLKDVKKFDTLLKVSEESNNTALYVAIGLICIGSFIIYKYRKDLINKAF